MVEFDRARGTDGRPRRLSSAERRDALLRTSSGLADRDRRAVREADRVEVGEACRVLRDESAALGSGLRSDN